MRTELRGELAGLRVELHTDIAGLRGELHTDVAGLRGELHTEIARLEEATIRGFTGVRRELDGLRGEVVQVNRRLDSLVDVAGAGRRDHEVRIAALEGAVSRLTGR